MSIITRNDVCKCDACGHQWLPQKFGKIPRRCASCKTTKWNLLARVMKMRGEFGHIADAIDGKYVKMIVREMIGGNLEPWLAGHKVPAAD